MKIFDKALEHGNGKASPDLKILREMVEGFFFSNAHPSEEATMILDLAFVGRPNKLGSNVTKDRLYEVMKLIRNDSGFKRKVAATGAKKFVMKIWAPRNGEWTLYKAKQQIAKQIKVTQVDGYSTGRVTCYITAGGGWRVHIC